jgi:hypothetical protein
LAIRATPELLFIPLRPVPTRIEYLAAKSFAEFFRVGFFLEALHAPPLVIVTDRVAVRT